MCINNSKFFFDRKFQWRIVFLAKITKAQNEVALIYHKMRGLYFLAVIVGATIYVFRRLKTCVYSSSFLVDCGQTARHNATCAISQRARTVYVQIEL